MSNSYGVPVGGQESTRMEGFGALADLAMDLRWAWSSDADELWQQLDAALWAQTHNPLVVLQTVSGESLKQRLSDPAFRQQVDNLIREKETADATVSWFSGSHPGSPLTTVAYFSMEFMLSEALPIY